MFTLIILGIIMTLLYYVLQGTKMSAAQKQYRNALEASYGGTEFVTKAIIPRLFTNYSSNKAGVLVDFGDPTNSVGLLLGDNLKEKLTNSTTTWSSAAMKTVNPKELPDITFTLKGTTGNDFRVYGKIVDTVSGVGLIDASGIDFIDGGQGVAGTSSSTQTPRTPNIYSIEIQGEAAVNPKEKAGLSVRYAY